MRVSEYFCLGRTQGDLDFIDIDIQDDTPLFLDPHALRYLSSQWGQECVSLLQDYFEALLEAARQENASRGLALLGGLHEPNETHLGLSSGRSKGHAIGSGFAQAIWEALSRSEAAKSGLLTDLEDTVLLISGIDRDLISDVTTNVIRQPLINYTKDVAAEYGIPLNAGVSSGPLWDPHRRRWFSKFVDLPRTKFGKLLLVPKVVARQTLEYDAGEYFADYVLEDLREAELSANTELVQTLKDGRRRVTKKDLIAKYGYGKDVSAQHTVKKPGILAAYRHDKTGEALHPLHHEDIAASAGGRPPDWQSLLSEVTGVSPGAEAADKYHRAVERLLTALFYPALTFPKREHRIHDGRKRIDITFVNTDNRGFFAWLSNHYAAANLIIECKNYSGDPGNPELDQISGRFSPSRGQVGFLICRTFHDKELFIQRCRDTAIDSRGYVLPFDDSDLSNLVRARRDADDEVMFSVLKERFDRLIM